MKITKKFLMDIIKEEAVKVLTRGDYETRGGASEPEMQLRPELEPQKGREGSRESFQKRGAMVTKLRKALQERGLEDKGGKESLKIDWAEYLLRWAEANKINIGVGTQIGLLGDTDEKIIERAEDWWRKTLRKDPGYPYHPDAVIKTKEQGKKVLEMHKVAMEQIQKEASNLSEINWGDLQTMGFDAAEEAIKLALKGRVAAFGAGVLGAAFGSVMGVLFPVEAQANTISGKVYDQLKKLFPEAGDDLVEKIILRNTSLNAKLALAGKPPRFLPYTFPARGVVHALAGADIEKLRQQAADLIAAVDKKLQATRKKA